MYFCTQDKERLSVRGQGDHASAAVLPGRLLPSSGHHEQDHRGIHLQSAALSSAHSHGRLPGRISLNFGEMEISALLMDDKNMSNSKVPNFPMQNEYSIYHIVVQRENFQCQFFKQIRQNFPIQN